MGPAGVGKTKVASTIGYVFSKSGILLNDKVTIGSPKDLIGEAVGETGPKTSEFLMSGLEGVLFIDEAYNIMPCDVINKKLQKGDSSSYGPDAITELVNFLDKYRGLAITVVAGYEDVMKNCFLTANEGLNRRFPKKMVLPLYTSYDLTKMFVNMVNSESGLENDKSMFTKTEVRYIYERISSFYTVFDNQAGDISNLVTKFYGIIYSTLTLEWNNPHLEEPQRTWVNLFLLNVTLSRFFEDKGYKIINGSLHHKSQSPSASKSKSSSTSSSTSTSSSIHSAVKSLKQNIKNIDTSLGSLKSKIKKLKKKK